MRTASVLVPDISYRAHSRIAEFSTGIRCSWYCRWAFDVDKAPGITIRNTSVPDISYRTRSAKH
eukprot:2548252-Rhodomonas_salina.2